MTLDRQRRWYGPITALVLGAAVTLVAPAQSASAATSTPWPVAPDWQSYGQAPSSATACPVAVVSTSGSVTGATNLLCGGAGGATLTETSGGSTPVIILDYGKDVGGLPLFTVTSASGSPQLKAGYAESKRYLTANGGEDPPWGEGDPSRSDTYTVGGAGTITNRFTQGGERYEEITLASPGTVSLSGVGITYIADRTQTSAYQGYFVSSSDQLNRIWYDSAYTAQLDSVPTGSLPGGAWAIQNGMLNALGGTAGLLNAGTAWTDYTATFDANIVNSQAGWMVRGRDAANGYLFILNAANDTAGTPNSLQELDVHDGTYTSVGTVTLPSSLSTGSWHTVSTTVSGTALTVSLDGTRIASLNSSSFPAGSTAFASGSVGFRENGTEQANFRNLKVVSSAGATLYSNALSTTASLKDFAVPGVNTLPSIVDGARRDRAIWAGDMDVEGPTVYYSTGKSEYLKGSLQLLGSYQLSSGFVTGALPPQTALHTGAKTPGTVGTYSASYSMYYVLGLAGYYLYTGDTAFVNSQWPVVQAELAWNATQLDSRGLFITNGADSGDWDFYDGSKTGAVSEVNLIYYKALLDGAQLATAVGQTALASSYTSQASTLKTAINTYLFNSGKGAYTISDTNAAVPQDANSMAVLYGVAPAAQVASILATLKTDLWTSNYGPLPYTSDAGNRAVISPFISGYELQARLAANDTANAEALLSNVWGHMIAAGPDQTSTMWENVLASDGTPGLGSTTNLSHGWSTAPTSALSGYTLGIQPVTAGYATWLVQPHPGSLSWAEGQAPTPHGALAVSWAGRSGVQQFSLQVTAPAGTIGTIAVPTYGASSPIVAVNGNVVWSGGAFTATGGVGGARADANFVFLTGVQPGTYTVASNPGNAAAAPAGYTACAAEGGTCSFTGTQSVAFGANGQYSYQTVTGGTGCNITSLVDADYGFAKTCYTGPVTAGPSGSTYCGAENGLCSFAGTRTVAYGAGSTFTTKSLTGGTPCTNAVFGDPVPNVVKACFVT
jgi:alpha-L-rhamnosidase